MGRFLLLLFAFFTLAVAEENSSGSEENALDDSQMGGLEGYIIFRDYYYLPPESSSSETEDVYDDIVSCGEGTYLNYASDSPMPMIGSSRATSEAACHYAGGKPYISFYTNVPRQLKREWFQIGFFARCYDDNPPFYSCNMSMGKPTGCDTISNGLSFVINQDLKMEPYEANDFFAKLFYSNDPSGFEIALPRNVPESEIMDLGNDAVKMMPKRYFEFYYENEFVFDENVFVDFGESVEEAMMVCGRLGEYYESNGTLTGFEMSSSSVAESSSAMLPNIPVSSSESMSSSSVETSSSAVSSSSVQSSSSVSVSSSSAENHCVAHPMNSAPADPKNACVSKSGKCYKCNASRSTSECVSEWLWTSPRDNFESYWYSEVDCETGALIENKGLGNCYAHPMNSAPADPKSVCVSKNGKCYKCNASRSASECASEWLWTSPRDNFESYWYTEVDCETGALVENKGLGNCYAHPMNSVPADPKSVCVSKNDKCYKCNASRSASECASEWLWTSPRDNFESYWYSEVDCQSAAPVLAKQGANGDTPVIANGRVPKANYSVNFTPRRYFDALGRSAKFTPFKHRPLFVDKPIVKKNELPFFTNEDKFTYGDDYMNFSGVLKKEGGGDEVICKNGDVCAEGVTCVAGSTGDMANTILVNLKNGAKPVDVSDKWSCYDGEARRLGESFVCGVEYYDYGVIEKDGTVVGGVTCTNINYSLYKPDEHGVADTNKVDYMLPGKSEYFPRSEKGKDECAVYDKDGKVVIHRNLTTSLILAVKTNVRIAYNNPHWVKENFKIYDKKGDYKFSVNKDKSDSIMRHEKNGHVPLYECLLKYGVLDTIHVILKDICEKDYEYDIESQYIVLYNEKDVEQLKDSVKSSKVASHLKKRIDAYMNATAEWFHNDARKKECDGLSSILKEECKNPKYDHFDGPYSPIECPSVKEIEKYVPRDLIP